MLFCCNSDRSNVIAVKVKVLQSLFGIDKYNSSFTMSHNAKSGVLAKICADKLIHIEAMKSSTTNETIIKKAAEATPTRNFIASIEALTSNKKNALIAEVKKASPSKGIIRQNFSPEEIAIAYESGGAACISVLTDEKYFAGCDENIEIVRRASELPVLRKDFMLDSYQVYEARALGADCILLIMAALTDAQAQDLENIAIKLGMNVLIEVHDEDELQRALKLKSKLIGINNRNLKTLTVDIATTEKLAAMVPSGYIIVCESGISTHEDILRMNKAGVYCFLVGESLMLQENVEDATRRLLYGSVR